MASGRSCGRPRGTQGERNGQRVQGERSQNSGVEPTGGERKEDAQVSNVGWGGRSHLTSSTFSFLIYKVKIENICPHPTHRSAPGKEMTM